MNRRDRSADHDIASALEALADAVAGPDGASDPTVLDQATVEARRIIDPAGSGPPPLHLVRGGDDPTDP